MLGNYASCTHVVSTVTLYRSSVVDLSRSRAVHAVEHDPCCPDPVRLQGATCRAVHYGLCSPLLKLPPFVIPIAPATVVKPNLTINTNKTHTPPSTPSTPTSVSVHPFASTKEVKSTSSSPTSPPVKSGIVGGPLSLISGFDPVQLLADADLEGQLEALVTSFVAQDKVRLARRSHPGGPAGSGPDAPNNNNKDPNHVFNGPTSNNTEPQSPTQISSSPVSSEAKQERRIIRRPGVEVVGGKLVPVSAVTKPLTPEYRRDGSGVKAQINRFAPSATERSKTDISIASSGSLQHNSTSLLANPVAVASSPSTSSSSTGQLSKQPTSKETPKINKDSSTAFVNSYANVSDERGNLLRSTITPTTTTSINNSQTEVSSLVNKPQLRNGHVTVDTKTKWDRVLLPGYACNDPPSLDRVNVDGGHLAKPTKASSPERLGGGIMAGPSFNNGEPPTIPHPKLTTVQRQHMRERSLSPTDRHHQPVRPFLTKGSVAERVLLFERAPSHERTQAVHPTSPVVSSVSSSAAGYPTSAVSNKSALLSSAWRGALIGGLLSEKDKENLEPGLLKTGSLRKLPKTATRATHNIPRFYYPNGKPLDPITTDEHLQKISTVFTSLGNRGVATLDQFGPITKACNLPLYCKSPLFQAAGGDKKGCVQCDAFLDYWRRVITASHEDSSIFIRILSKGFRNYIIPEDFILMMQDIIETHPGLTFLKDAPEFHSRYVHTVIARIFYCVNRSWTGKITTAELRKSNFLRVLHLLEEEEDINQITEYFSYEHFYVIYCKFWELDKDHDLFIDKADLSRHNDGAISARMISRIFSGAVTRGPVIKHGKMSYSEFVWFLISEEDKRHPRSIEYWFRCMDIDGDGFLSMYELEYFYDEQLHRMESLGIETLPYKDCLCQMLDMIRPKVPGCISLSDLKKCKLTPIFFDTFFNLEKYLDHEQRDPFASQRDHEDDLSISDWDRFAAEEYELLVSEENANDQQEDLMYEEYDESELGARFEKMAQLRQQNLCRQQDNDEDYDYAETDVDYHY